MVRRLLFIITYFLRCNEVFELHSAKKQFAITPTSGSSQDDNHHHHDDTHGHQEKPPLEKEQLHLSGDCLHGCDGACSAAPAAPRGDVGMTEVDMRSNVCLRLHPDLSARLLTRRPPPPADHPHTGCIGQLLWTRAVAVRSTRWS